jgi:glucose-1-phosphate cytidylyltransferase
VFDYIDGDEAIFEREPLERLSKDEQLAAYKHDGFWYGMDTMWDKIYLDRLWQEGAAPWKLWHE